MCRYCLQKEKGPVTVSIKKIENIKKNFHWIDWEIQSIFILYEGCGDMPQYAMFGKYKNKDVLYQSAKPGGGEPSIIVVTSKEAVHFQLQSNSDYLVKIEKENILYKRKPATFLCAEVIRKDMLSLF